MRQKSDLSRLVDFQKLTSIKIQNDKMRTGNLPANMKKNRVLQIIPCRWWNDSSDGFPLTREIESNGFCCLTDEFNRVIIPVKRGEENTDYVNASFIDVSERADDLGRVPTPRFSSLLSVFLPPSSSCSFTAGVPSEGLLHGEPGASAAHHGGLLEDDLGVEKLLHSHAHRAGRERAGWWTLAQPREG